MGTERKAATSPHEAVLKMRAAAKLTQRGVSVLGADALLAACAEDGELVLATLPRPRFDGLRVGDRVNAPQLGQTAPKSLVIEVLEVGTACVAFCGRPVEASNRDDVRADLPVKRRA